MTDPVRLTPKQQELYDALRSGVSQADYARAHELPQPSVSAMVRRIRANGYAIPKPTGKHTRMMRGDMARAKTIIIAHKLGMTAKEIATDLKCSQQLVYYHLKKRPEDKP